MSVIEKHVSIKQCSSIFDSPEIVEYYDDLVSKGLYSFEWKFLKLVCPAINGPRVLNVGCGAGREAIALARMGLRVTATDISEAMLERALKNARTNGVRISFKLTNGLDVPFSNSFDLIFATHNLIGHIVEKPLRISFLENVRRALKTNGILVLSYHCLYHDENKRHDIKNTETKRGCFKVKALANKRSHKTVSLKMFDQEEIKQEIVEAGFTVVAIRSIDELALAGESIPWHKSVCFLAAEKKDRRPILRKSQ